MARTSEQDSRGATDHAVMRELNRQLVLGHLRRHAEVSRSRIADATGLAKPTVSLIVEDLLAEGLIVETGRGGTTAAGGRPPIMLAFNVRSSYLAGVHVGVRRTTVVVSDALAHELATVTVATPTGAPRPALKRIAAVVRRTLGDAEAEAERVATGGICLPGLVSADDGRLLVAPNLGWRDVPAAAILEEELGFPVTAHNASQTALVAEVAEGAVAGERDVVLLYAGTGVGAAAMARGQLLSGHRGLAGELGHCRVIQDGAPCNCGKTGCLETVASARAVVARAEAAWARTGAAGRPAGLAGGEATAEDVAHAAAVGDIGATEALGAAGRALGEAAAWLANLLDPSSVVLAGGLAGSGDALVGPFRETLLTELVPADPAAPAGRELRVVVSQLGQAAEVRGVLLLARERAQAGIRVVAG